MEVSGKGSCPTKGQLIDPAQLGSYPRGRHRYEAGRSQMAKWAFVLLLVAPCLTGCGMTSDVQSMEDGTYLIAANTTPIWDAPSDARDFAFRGAEEFCRSQKRRVVVISDNSGGHAAGATGFSASSGGRGVFAAGSASLNFRCQ